MMADDKEKLIQKVVAEVLKAMDQSVTPDVCADAEGFEKMLVIGSLSKVSEAFKEDYRLFEIEDYGQHKNIRRYQKVLIAELSMTALADTALGRGADDASEAIICALLSGIEVLMLKDALPYKKYAGQGSTKLYALLEGYANTLQTYGVKLVKETVPVIVKEAKPAKFAPQPTTVPKGSGMPNADRLITEDKALSMISDCDGTVCLCKNAIVTPSAWDVFERQKIKVIRQ